MNKTVISNLNKLTLLQAIDGLKAGDFTSEDITKACLKSIKDQDDKINAFITVTEDIALKEAKNADELIKKEGIKAFDTKPLLGVPYALKDNFCTKDLRTTASTKILDNYVPPYESTVSKKLKDAGAVLLGKTNMDALAHGSSTETSDYFVTKNPRNLKKLPGGSSGGSAAAIAADMCIFAIGSETAGSIRQPAAWCGVVGLKPTYGRVSRFGVIAMASSTDSPGPITKTVQDSALVLEVIAGPDENDATTSDTKVLDYLSLTANLTNEKLKIGVPKSYFVEGIEKGVKESVERSIELFKSLGHEIIYLDMLDPKFSIAVYTIIQRSEVSSNLSRFDGLRFGKDRDVFGKEAKNRIMLGTYTLSAGYYDKYYAKAQKVRTLIIEDFRKAFEKVDVIVGPTSPCTALEIGASTDNAMFGEMQDALLEPSSMAGITGINIPCGYSNDMPVGIQIMADKFNEVLALQAAYLLEQELKKEN